MYVDPTSLDAFALGVVVFEYVASFVEGHPITRDLGGVGCGRGEGGGDVGGAGCGRGEGGGEEDQPFHQENSWIFKCPKPRRPGTSLRDRCGQGSGAAAGGGKGVPGGGWVSCERWQQVVCALCHSERHRRLDLAQVSRLVEADALLLAQEILRSAVRARR